MQETKVLRTLTVREGALLKPGLHPPTKKMRIFFREARGVEGDVDETSDLHMNRSGAEGVHAYYQRMTTANQILFPKKMHLSQMKDWQEENLVRWDNTFTQVIP